MRRVLAFGAFAALALVTIVIGAASAAGPTSRALESQRRAAVLELYALDAKVGAAQRTLYDLQQRETALRAEQQLLQQELGATKATLAHSRSHLAANLRDLYKRGNVSALAVVLGSQSLVDAVALLDTLTSVTDQSERDVAVTQHARTRFRTLRKTLQFRQSALAAAVATARRTLASLEAARGERVAFIVRLRRRERVRAVQIRAMETNVRRAEVKAAQLAPAAPTAQASAGARELTVSSTGYSLPGHTATGLPVGWGVVSVDPAVIPLGTKLTIPGYGDGVAADVGSAVRGDAIDLWFPTIAAARAWGRRTVTIGLH